jgi:hypothetical protein
MAMSRRKLVTISALATAAITMLPSGGANATEGPLRGPWSRKTGAMCCEIATSPDISSVDSSKKIWTVSVGSVVPIVLAVQKPAVAAKSVAKQRRCGPHHGCLTVEVARASPAHDVVG